MSKIFYDHLITLNRVEIVIKNSAQTSEEKEELWHLVDQTIHPRVLTTILDNLPRQHHEEFLQKFHASPHDECLIDYLNEKVEGNIEELITKEMNNLEEEIVRELKGKTT
jgi:hypothetical protein